MAPAHAAQLQGERCKRCCGNARRICPRWDQPSTDPRRGPNGWSSPSLTRSLLRGRSTTRHTRRRTRRGVGQPPPRPRSCPGSSTRNPPNIRIEDLPLLQYCLSPAAFTHSCRWHTSRSNEPPRRPAQSTNIGWTIRTSRRRRHAALGIHFHSSAGGHAIRASLEREAGTLDRLLCRRYERAVTCGRRATAQATVVGGVAPAVLSECWEDLHSGKGSLRRGAVDGPSSDMLVACGGWLLGTCCGGRLWADATPSGMCS